MCLFYGEQKLYRCHPSAVEGQPTEIRNTHINIGTGEDISIKDLAELVKHTVGFEGGLYFNSKKPDGTLKKLTDISKLKALGWRYRVTLKKGIDEAYDFYINN